MEHRDHPVRFGIIGCGFIARRFAKALEQSESAVLYAAAARNRERAEEFASEYGGVKAYGSYEALLRDPEVDAVYIATVNSTHAEIARMCIEAGKPVLCEKPLFMSRKEAQEVIRASRETGVLIMEGMWTRCLPAYHQTKRWIAEGKIGQVKLIRAAFCFPMPYNRETKDYRLFNPATGGGSWLDVGVYPYEYITGIMGGAPEDVRFLHETGPTGVDLSVGMILRYRSGTIGDCLSSIAGYMDEDAVAAGSEGYIIQRNFFGSRRTELYDNQGKLLDSFDDPEEEGFVHEISHFCGLLRDGKTESDWIPMTDSLDFAGVYEQLLERTCALEICHAAPEDLPEIQRIYGFARKYMRANGNHRQWVGGYPSEVLLLEDMEKKQLYVIKAQGSLCGVFAFIIGEDPTYANIEGGSWISDSPYGTIHRIASDGTQRGILRKACQFCRTRIAHLRIDTHADNILMQRAILRNGFVKCGTIYLPDGSPRIAYELWED
ncbi:MAG: Gfo/Idh/MocA family oxidoreductase [Parasporobacterium sp.]|nr:Gfo/Idh/MocA family oxidoreductase [Parasporobacterium sp.]